MAGKIVHFEVPSGDAGRASAFYGGLFGYQIGDSMMEGVEYRMFQSAEDQGGAIMSSDSFGLLASASSYTVDSCAPSCSSSARGRKRSNSVP